MLMTSETAAESVNTNPVVVRRIFGSLRNAGLVSSHSGPSGGWTLQRSADLISLRDVFCAVEEVPLFSMHNRPPSTSCSIGCNIQGALQGFLSDAQAALEEKLAGATIADVLAAVHTRAGLSQAV